MSDEADNLVIRLLQDMRTDMATKSELANLATKGDLAALRSDVDDLRHDVTQGFATLTKALSDVRLGDRLTAIEKRLTDLERRHES